MQQRKVTESLKKRIAGKQLYKCANHPHVELEGIENYSCPLWIKEGADKGSFDESGYEIDHIVSFCISTNDSENNLQALCKMCHTVKTKRFLSSRMKNDNNDNNEDSDNRDILCKYLNNFNTRQLEQILWMIDVQMKPYSNDRDSIIQFIIKNTNEKNIKNIIENYCYDKYVYKCHNVNNRHIFSSNKEISLNQKGYGYCTYCNKYVFLSMFHNKFNNEEQNRQNKFRNHEENNHNMSNENIKRNYEYPTNEIPKDTNMNGSQNIVININMNNNTDNNDKYKKTNKYFNEQENEEINIIQNNISPAKNNKPYNDYPNNKPYNDYSNNKKDILPNDRTYINPQKDDKNEIVIIEKKPQINNNYQKFIISMKSHHNKWLCMDKPDKGSKVVANRQKVDKFETFELHLLEGINKVQIKNTTHRTYLCADDIGFTKQTNDDKNGSTYWKMENVGKSNNPNIIGLFPC